VIAALAAPSAMAAKAATTTIPVAFEVGVDPVEIGLIGSLSRPGGNITGVTNLNVELGPKKLELLHRLVPAAPRIAALFNPANPNSGSVQKGMQAAARTLGVEVDILRASTDREIDTAFASLVQARAGGLFISPDPFFVGRTKQIAALTVRHAVPAVFEFREFVAAGGLISYGSNLRDAYRLVGHYVGRILKGDKPTDLPVQQVVKVELIINLKTAKALDLTIPETLLGRAHDEASSKNLRRLPIVARCDGLRANPLPSTARKQAPRCAGKSRQQKPPRCAGQAAAAAGGTHPGVNGFQDPRKAGVMGLLAAPVAMLA
jgi:putative ABC transport system substrate-binding protein